MKFNFEHFMDNIGWALLLGVVAFLSVPLIGYAIDNGTTMIK